MSTYWARRLVVLLACVGALICNNVCAAATGFHPLSDSDRAARVAELEAGMNMTFTKFQAKIAPPDAMVDCRELTWGALANLQFDGDPSLSVALIRRALASQNVDSTSKGYGAFPWTLNNPKISDDNSCEFTLESIGPILLRYGKQLPPGFISEIKPNMEAAFADMKRRFDGKSPAYTNIYLMHCVDLILCGEAVGDSDAADLGYQRLDQWIAFTQQVGIREYESTTYTETDLSSLDLGYLYAARPGAQAKFKTILDFFWTDLAANFFPGRGTLSGAHSRDYDFVNGDGSIEVCYYLEGFRDHQNLRNAGLDSSFLVEGARPEAYHPSAKITQLASIPTRTVVSHWGEKPEQDRYNYITPDFAISAAESDYGNQDKLIDIEMASPTQIPAITIVPDSFDAPYGKVHRLEKSGHDKPYHWPSRINYVQHEGTILALLDVNPAQAGPLTSFATNIVFPESADTVLLDGQPAKLALPFDQPGKVGSVLALRIGGAGVAIRVFRADGAGGQAASVHLKDDADPKLKLDAARLAIYHYQGDSQTLTDTHARVGLLIEAAHCATDADLTALAQKVQSATIDDNLSGSVWTVNASGAGASLGISRDTQAGTILSRTVNGKPVSEPPPLMVNGHDLTGVLGPTIPYQAPGAPVKAL